MSSNLFRLAQEAAADSTPAATPPRLVQIGIARPDVPVRGDRLFQAAEKPVSYIDQLVGRVLPPALNPLARAGSVANTTFLIAAVTGILLLFWYVPSVHQAYQSLDGLREGSFFGATLGQIVRSLHRYSSDACMLFVIIHAIQIVLARRFTGARWSAWLTGITLIGLLWLVGWLGYWLVWDERAHLVALGSARVVDPLPVFNEPLSRTFLVDAGVSSMLFFMVFFAHMLLPLGMGIALWLHITRLSRPRFLANRTLTAWVLGSLALISVLKPANNAAAAQMTTLPTELTVDAWYLLPLAITDRLGSAGLWTLVLLGGALLFGVPRLLRTKKTAPAVVDIAKCNGCTLCYEDCPYDAIRMVPRTDGKPYPSQAEVDPDKCVGCGICAGSCNSAGIGLGAFAVVDVRKQIESWIDSITGRGEAARIAFICGSSAGRNVLIDPATGLCDQLPGYRVFAVPCAGWVHALTVERALKRGAEGVLIVSCGHGEVTFREGADWTEARLSGERKPILREEKVDPNRVRVVRCEPSALGSLQAEAAAFARGLERAAEPSRRRQLVFGVATAAVLSSIVLIGSDLPYKTPPGPPAELVVSFRHSGASGEACRTLTEAELAALPAHMRRTEVCERGRAAVRLRVAVNGEVVHEDRYEARGLSGDGPSIALEKLPLEPGEHDVEVFIGETGDPEEWTHRSRQTVTMGEGERRVVLFDRSSGFSWHGGG